MGEVKDKVVGNRSAARVDPESLTGKLHAIAEEISGCIMTKDMDAFKEGESERASNIRKAALMRASHTLLMAAAHLLGEYDAETKR